MRLKEYESSSYPHTKEEKAKTCIHILADSDYLLMCKYVL